MNTPDHDTGIWFAIRRDVAWHTIMEEWPRIKADIDGGMLSPLALVTVYTTDPTMMGRSGSPSKKSTITSCPTRGCQRAP